jgi:hypothetical protein
MALQKGLHPNQIGLWRIDLVLRVRVISRVLERYEFEKVVCDVVKSRRNETG